MARPRGASHLKTQLQGGKSSKFRNAPSLPLPPLVSRTACDATPSLLGASAGGSAARVTILRLRVVCLVGLRRSSAGRDDVWLTSATLQRWMARVDRGSRKRNASRSGRTNTHTCRVGAVSALSADADTRASSRKLGRVSPERKRERADGHTRPFVRLCFFLQIAKGIGERLQSADGGRTRLGREKERAVGKR